MPPNLLASKNSTAVQGFLSPLSSKGMILHKWGKLTHVLGIQVRVYQAIESTSGREE